ncbi:type II toxin-antitoxin system HipA family toxin [Oceanibaculum pacificum]|uniref:Phosphatidylinositol kinase n=1 Tax=Oceanibaculum pacificum TaxID=580166 RepID=A0A154W1K9_9PROT|nr:type II toxin-antitoxin system HipA family toxin [Oceanibaculum pacificum]KZD07380.1 phosphatidylinositol kinase [Oceanibaculum pacificum]
MTSERECYVYIVPPGETAFVTAGRFRWTEDSAGAVGAFVYGRSYRERADAVEIDPVELRLSGRVYETARMDGFFGAIRDAMPDFWGRRVIERNAGLTELEEFDYLLQGPDDRAGALGFGLNVEPPAPQRRFNRTVDLERLQRAADAIVADDPDGAGSAGRQAEELLMLGTSMGGARPKAVVQQDNDLWIAKFSRQDDRWNYPRVEHGLLKLAETCGLDVADSRMETVGGRDVLLVRRFDRDWAETGYRRHRMVSALTLLRAGDAPGERGDWSYLLLADEIRRVSTRPEDDLRELFGRICFNAAVSNLDDHPRNHAVLAKDRDWRLSPAFDLTPSPVVAVDRRDLAMACGRFGRYANKMNLLSDSGRFLLNREEATFLFERITATVRDEWRPTMRRAGASEADCEAIRSAFVYDGLFYEDAA